MRFFEQFKQSVTIFTCVFIAVAIGLNIVVGQLVALLKLPVFLDSIGTVLVGVLIGPWAGGVTGFLTNLIWGVLVSHVVTIFAPVAMVIGVTAGFCARYGLFRDWWLAIIAGFIITVFNAAIAVPIRLYFFEGVTGSGVDFFIAYMLALGADLFGSVVITVTTSNFLDKVVTALLVYNFLQFLPAKITARFSGSSVVD